MIVDSTLVKRIGKVKYDGSSLDVGKTYQQIPDTDIPYHRSNIALRVAKVKKYLDITSKSVLDLGCNVGVMANMFLEHGAKSVHGIDHDTDSIVLGKSLFPKVSFTKMTLQLESVKSLDPYDICIWFDQFNWLVHQLGMEEALDCLYEISKRCDYLFFESSSKGDNSAPLDMTQDEIGKFLIKNTCYTEFTDMGQSSDTLSLRRMFMLSNPLKERKTTLTSVSHIGRGLVKKAFLSSFLKNRELEFLKILDGYGYFPTVISDDYCSITMEDSGVRARWISEKDMKSILGFMEQYGIKHKDISPENILWNGDNCVLIDFLFAENKNEETLCPMDLGGMYKCPHGFNDEYSIMKVRDNFYAHTLH